MEPPSADEGMSWGVLHAFDRIYPENMGPGPDQIPRVQFEEIQGNKPLSRKGWNNNICSGSCCSPFSCPFIFHGASSQCPMDRAWSDFRCTCITGSWCVNRRDP